MKRNRAMLDKVKYMKKRYWCIIGLCTIVIVYLALLQANKIMDKDVAVLYAENGEELITMDESWFEEWRSDEVIMKNAVVDTVIRQLYTKLHDDGMTDEEFEKCITEKGWQIYTTVDAELQDNIENYFRNEANFSDSEGVIEIETVPQSAMIVLDYEGLIKAIVGGVGENTEKNRAARELYQVGSTIKPVAIYAPALANKLIHYSTMCDDTPGNTVVGQKNIQWPSNSDNVYEGEITVAYALAKSKNTVPVNLGMMLGEEYIYNYLKKIYFPTLIDGENGESDKQLAALALGYFAKGVSLDRLVAAYEPFGNGGKYYEPTIFSKVVDRNGNEIVNQKLQAQEIMDENSAYIMNRLLVNNVNGEGGIASDAQIDELEVAGKTGTVATEMEDVRKLFVGMTPEYIVGVQVGHDGENIPLMGRYKPPITIWRELISRFPHEEKVFKKSLSVLEKKFCRTSGKLESGYCIDLQSGYYTDDNIPETCTECEK